MPSTSVAVSRDGGASAPTIAPKSEKILRVTGKNKAAIDAMVWEGLKRSEAAERAGLKDHALYVALTKPHVKAYYLSQCEVLRTSGRARRIHRLEQMSEQDENKAAVVNAIRALELMGADEAMTGGRTALPGLQIVIVQGSNPVVRTIDDERHAAISNG